MAILESLSNQGSLVSLERFAMRHRQTLNELLDTDYGKSPTVSTFLLVLAQHDVGVFEGLKQQWMEAQSGVAVGLNILLCDGKNLRGWIDEKDSGAVRYGLRPTASTSPR